jgi:glycosyltransferase involved in cell wall biosynthesis
MARLSVVIITHNEEFNISRCLESVRDFADEIVVVDSLSGDKTVEICKAFGCRVIFHEFEGYGRQKQFAIEQAANDWIYSLDADEVLTDELKAEILGILASDKNSIGGYRVPEAFMYLGKILKHSVTYPLRFFNRTKGRFTDALVHEEFIVEGVTGKLKGKMIHYSYRSLEHHLQKINHYTTQAAIKYSQNNKSFSKIWVVLKFPVNFFIFYFIRLGILDGYPGFMWSFLAAFYGSLKIAKTIEYKNRE